jgi:hypothetical protein
MPSALLHADTHDYPDATIGSISDGLLLPTFWACSGLGRLRRSAIAVGCQFR